MPTLEVWIYYCFGAILLASVAGYGVLTFFENKARREQKRAEAWLHKHEATFAALKNDVQKIRAEVLSKTSIQQSEARISKAIADLLVSAEEEERVIAKARS